jgi:hypothetical protein
MGQRVRITAKRRESINLDQLALALLDFVNSLSDEERNKLATEGVQVLDRLQGGEHRRTKKGSAA